MARRAVIVIPTYNEYHNIRPLVDRILDLPLPLDLFFVDDASPDGTGRPPVPPGPLSRRTKAPSAARRE